MHFSRMLNLLLVGLALLQAAHFAPLLPDPVAAHFDAAGGADGWSTRSGFLTGNLVMVALMALLFVGLSAWIGRVPSAWINLPNKDYWLAPERRSATLGFIRQQMEWFGALTLALLLGINQLTIQANLASTETLPGDAFWLLFGSYMAFVMIWLAWLLRTLYARVPRLDDAP